MGKQFDEGDTVRVARNHVGTVLGEDRENPGLYRVRMIDGPQAGKIYSYVFTMLDKIRTR